MLTVQVGQDLYGYLAFGPQSRLDFISGLDNGQYKTTKKAAPKIAREFPNSPVVYNDMAIYVSGGYDPSNESTFFTSVDRYDILKNTWSVAPAMKAARAMHSSSVIGDFLYVFGGCRNTNNDLTEGIERLNVSG